MYEVTVRDHMLVAHSLRGAGFGPAQRLHGATYVVDATFRGDRLDAAGILVDVGAAAAELAAVCAHYGYRNLDDDPEFSDRNSTTEVLAAAVTARLAGRVREGALGPAPGVRAIRVTLHESHVASAAYEAEL